jgi:predicted amino acid racemase
MTTTNLDKYKKIKKLNKLIEELTQIQKLLSISLLGFSTYKKYVPVKDVINSILTNKAMVDLSLKKFKRSLEQLNENELE